jgi:hypothetical protein
MRTLTAVIQRTVLTADAARWPRECLVCTTQKGLTSPPAQARKGRLVGGTAYPSIALPASNCRGGNERIELRTRGYAAMKAEPAQYSEVCV